MRMAAIGANRLVAFQRRTSLPVAKPDAFCGNFRNLRLDRRFLHQWKQNS
jgi:hypothetical protein